MKIYAIDDKREELKNAHEAILKAGHEVSDLGPSQILMFNEKFGKKYENRGQLAQLELFQAVLLIKEQGGGIVTDMMFNLKPQTGDVPPSGILVVLHALAFGVPVVVCTDAEEVGGHHSRALSWIHDSYIVPANRCGVLPFGWVENKNWEEAVKKLEYIHQKSLSRQ